MHSSLPWLRLALLAPVVVVAGAALAGCPGRQPPECAAYLACFHPADGDGGPLGQIDDHLDDAGVSERAREVYGENGECWRYEGDRLSQACRDACTEAIRADCVAAATGDSFCSDGITFRAATGPEVDCPVEAQ